MMPGEPQGNQLPDLDVESLLAVLDEISEPRVREAALNLLEAVLGLHRVGFGRILNVVKSHPAGALILQRLREDPVVVSLLMSHDLLEPEDDLEARVRAALEKVRPYMHGHGGDVEIVEVRGGRVRVTLTGACHGCGFSENTLRLGIERILRTDVPEVAEILVTGTDGRPAGSNGSEPAVAADGWERVGTRESLPEGTLRVAPTRAGRVLLCAAYGRVYAFRDACPGGGGSMAGGTLIAFILKCPCHGLAFDVRSGRCLGGRELALEPLPSAWEDGRLRVAV